MAYAKYMGTLSSINGDTEVFSTSPYGKWWSCCLEYEEAYVRAISADSAARFFIEEYGLTDEEESDMTIFKLDEDIVDEIEAMLCGDEGDGDDEEGEE